MKNLLLDFGNVLGIFDHMKICREFSRWCGFAPEEFYFKVFKSGIEKSYDEGKNTSEEFHQRVCETLEYSIPLNSFHKIWGDIFTETEINTKVGKLLEKFHLNTFMFFQTQTRIPL